MDTLEVKELCAAIRSLIESAAQSIDRARVDAARDALEALLKEIPADAGGSAAAAWADLAETERERLAEHLTTLQTDVDALLASRRCADAGPLMSEKCVPTGWIAVLLLLAVAGTLGTLVLIGSRWQAATEGGASAEERRAALESATDRAARLKKQTEAAKEKRESLQDDDPTAGAASQEVQRAQFAEQKAWIEVATIKQMLGPSPKGVLIMVILFGALGGFVHMASSLTIYIGNRQLVRSWIVYYLLAPVQGAALAPVAYLVFTGTVLEAPFHQEAGTGGLNLTGIYGFSALTGLFAKQAIEKLREVFSTVFTKIKARDATSQ